MASTESVIGLPGCCPRDGVMDVIFTSVTDTADLALPASSSTARPSFSEDFGRVIFVYLAALLVGRKKIEIGESVIKDLFIQSVM